MNGFVIQQCEVPEEKGQGKFGKCSIGEGQVAKTTEPEEPGQPWKRGSERSHGPVRRIRQKPSGQTFVKPTRLPRRKLPGQAVKLESGDKLSIAARIQPDPGDAFGEGWKPLRHRGRRRRQIPHACAPGCDGDALTRGIEATAPDPAAAVQPFG